jgi:hypothetical protein
MEKEIAAMVHDDKAATPTSKRRRLCDLSVSD